MEIENLWSLQCQTPVCHLSFLNILAHVLDCSALFSDAISWYLSTLLSVHSLNMNNSAAPSTILAMGLTSAWLRGVTYSCFVSPFACFCDVCSIVLLLMLFYSIRLFTFFCHIWYCFLGSFHLDSFSPGQHFLSGPFICLLGCSLLSFYFNHHIIITDAIYCSFNLSETAHPFFLLCCLCTPSIWITLLHLAQFLPWAWHLHDSGVLHTVVLCHPLLAFVMSAALFFCSCSFTASDSLLSFVISDIAFWVLSTLTLSAQDNTSYLVLSFVFWVAVYSLFISTIISSSLMPFIVLSTFLRQPIHSSSFSFCSVVRWQYCNDNTV